jgi:hypothetical protein
MSADFNSETSRSLSSSTFLSRLLNSSNSILLSSLIFAANGLQLPEGREFEDEITLKK